MRIEVRIFPPRKAQTERGGVRDSDPPRWYPVIDFRQRNDCPECLNFCLFGVYSVHAAGPVGEEQPDACRPGCRKRPDRKNSALVNDLGGAVQWQSAGTNG